MVEVIDDVKVDARQCQKASTSKRRMMRRSGCSQSDEEFPKVRQENKSNQDGRSNRFVLVGFFFLVKFALYGLVQNLLIAIDGGKRVMVGAQFTVMNSEGLDEFDCLSRG